MLEERSRLCEGVHLILGGARSGKSLFAEDLAAWAERPIYLATARALDQEMERRIALHRQRRPPHWLTVEEPLNLTRTLQTYAAPEGMILVDCLTMWVSNVLWERGDPGDDIDSLLDFLPSVSGTVVFVANEVGLGGVPSTESGRAFLDCAGVLHQRIAQYSQSVVLIVSGLPITLKRQRHA